MSFLAAPPVVSSILHRSSGNARTDGGDLHELQQNPESSAGEDGAQRTHHGREASGRSMLSNISDRLASMRERERESERSRQMQRASAMAERLRLDLNNWRGVNGDRDLEAQTQEVATGAGATASGTQAGVNGNASSLRKITGKSRREREEGAALFGPNLANYFGSGSSSSGAVAGAAVATIVPPMSPGAEGSALHTHGASEQPTTAAATSLSIGAADAANPFGSLQRPRLGSRGRARGASLSGLSQWSLQGDAIESAASLLDANDPLSPRFNQSEQDPGGSTGQQATGALSMAEGIELDTLKRWIDRSRVGGALQIASAEGVANLHSDEGNPFTLCSTLQSYVNLKRNTVKLHSLPQNSESTPIGGGTHIVDDAATRTPFSPLSPTSAQSPSPTHSIQFEYDCASPFAAVQVFVRASRKHGSWLAWTTAREAMGLPTDLTFGAEDDGESRFLGQRGPPPHILGWPVHLARVRKGFGTPLKVELALRLELYAPPKAPTSVQATMPDIQKHDDPDTTGKKTSKVNEGPSLSLTSTSMPSVPVSAHIPETPGLDSSRRFLDDAPTPAATTQPVQDPLSSATYTANRNVPFVVSNSALPSSRPAGNAEADAGAKDAETKEEKTARERAERETLKVAIVVEALDEDGKPLREPNLQTTYMRLASLPIKESSNDGGDAVELADERIGDELREAGPVLDVAVTPSQKANLDLSSAKRAWSVQVEGQESEIGPHRFQLQELYGLSSKPPPPQQQQHQHTENQDGEAGLDEDGGATGGATNDPMPSIPFCGDDSEGATECLICLSSPPSTLLLPCTHGLCLDCAVQLRDTVKATRESERRRGRRPKRKYACPVCRRVYTSMLHLNAVDEKYLAQAGGSF